MIKPAYYNEIDPWAAALLRNLIKAGHIAPGDVDTRSIEDVKPDDLRAYKQCHFFAGAGVWSAALRRAGWPDDKRVWTGSAPCQPFSAAGAGAGFDDERHLWPALHYLIQQCRPERIYGEQVASKAVDAWLDLVHADMEGLGYAFGACAFPSAGVGAPHIRDRTYWLADADNGSEHALLRAGKNDSIENLRRGFVGRLGEQLATGFESEPEGFREIGDVRLGHTDNQGPQGHAGHDSAAGRSGSAGSIAASGVFGGVGHTDGERAGRDGRAVSSEECGQNGKHVPEHVGASGAVSRLADTNGRPDGRQGEIITWANVGGLAPGDGGSNAGYVTAGPTNGLWANADWLFCRDGKWRPVEPGTFPLAHGAPARVGRLRAYGNACNLEAAYEFIMATIDY